LDDGESSADIALALERSAESVVGMMSRLRLRARV